jgi:hypothetical protein
LPGRSVIAEGIWRVEPQRIPSGNAAEKFAGAGTRPALRRFSIKCSNLTRGESMKDPVCIFECRRGFILERLRPHAIAEPCDLAGLTIGLRRN